MQCDRLCTQHAASHALLRLHDVASSMITWRIEGGAPAQHHNLDKYSAARDIHMADTAGMLVDHLKSRGIDRPKIVICALRFMCLCYGPCRCMC
jgi:hypothetical protein